MPSKVQSQPIGENSLKNQSVKQHRNTDLRVLNAEGDGNCGLNAFILALYAAMRVERIDLTYNSAFAQFLFKLNSKLVNDYGIDGIITGEKGQVGFLHAMEQLQAKQPRRSLKIMQKVAAPILRDMAVKEQQRFEQQEKIDSQKVRNTNELKMTNLGQTFLNIVAEGVHAKLYELDFASFHKNDNNNDDFNGINAIKNKIDEYTQQVFDGLLQNHKEGDPLITFDAISDICRTDANLIQYWETEGEAEYFKAIGQNGTWVSPRTLQRLADLFGIDLNCKRNGQDVARAKDNIKPIITLQNNDCHWNALVDSQEYQAVIPTNTTVDTKNLANQGMFSTLKQMANLSEADFEAEKKKEGLTDQAIKELMYFYKGPGEGASEQEKQDFEMAKDLQLQELRKSCS